jgi:phosphatidylcholine synthase
MQRSTIRWFTIRAWLVHLYTSLGILAGLMAINAIFQQDVRRVFLWLGVALFIDSSDGTLARAWEVKRWAPSFDGRKLDDITDYLNFTFIPVLFAYQMGMVTGVGVVALGAVLISSAYGFCQLAAKTNDGYFTGFPSFWNLLVFYLYLFNMPPMMNAFILFMFSVMVFVPIKYLSFSTPQMQRITKGIAAAYGVILALIVIRLNQPQIGLILISLVFPVAYMLYPLVERRRMRRMGQLVE